MNAHTTEEQQEMTFEEHYARLSELRRRKAALLWLPVETNTIHEMYELKADYRNAGYLCNADAIGRRIDALGAGA